MDRVDQSRAPTGSTARYNDVLGLGALHDEKMTHLDIATASRRLTNLGFLIRQPAPGHWIVNISGESRQIHLYGAIELSHFVARVDPGTGIQPRQRPHPLLRSGTPVLFEQAGECL